MEFNSQQRIRIDIIAKYIEGEIQLEDALVILGIKERQFRRKIRAFRQKGPVSVIHGNKGQIPSNKTSDFLSKKICYLYRMKYFDLTVAHFIEKLIEIEQLPNVPSYTTIRKILLNEGLLIRKNKKPKKSYRRRKRYEQEGVMIQIDGSHHHWIVGHSPICLTAAIDDATGKVLGAKFTRTETTFAAMDVVEQIIKRKGVFQMLYSDKAGIYGGGKRQGYSNMDRAMREIGVICVQANSPQAKGRVERLFGTLQNRLVQELRLNNVRDMEGANRFLKEYLPVFNAKFGRAAENEMPVYRPLDRDIDLEEVLCMKEMRVVKNGNVINYEGASYVIEKDEYLCKKQVEIRHYKHGGTSFILDGEKVMVRRIKKDKMAA